LIIFSDFLSALLRFAHLEELHLTNAFVRKNPESNLLSQLKQVFLKSKLERLKKIHLEENYIE